MALFNPRKRSHPPTVTVEPAPSAPAPEPVSAQLAQSSPALPGGGLRLVSPTQPGLRLAPAAPADGVDENRVDENSVEENRVDENRVDENRVDENRAEDFRGLPLGTILYRRGLLQQDVLEDALVSGMESGERLGEVLIGRGLIAQADLARALAAQHGLPFVPEAELALDRKVAALLPLADARKLHAIPLRADGYAITVVTAEPSPIQKDALESRLHRPVIQSVVSKGAFEALLLDLGRAHRPAAVVALAAVPDEPAFDDAEHYEEPQEELMVLSESLRSAEETVAERDHRLSELTARYEAGDRRIAELVAQVHEREEELRSVGACVQDLSSRLAAAEERLDDRERRLDELFRHVERRDGALADSQA